MSSTTVNPEILLPDDRRDPAPLAGHQAVAELDLFGRERISHGATDLPDASAERTVIYLTGVTAEVADAPRLLLTVMFWGLVSLKNDPVYCPLPPVNSAPLQF
jgi:hypothetical protein